MDIGLGESLPIPFPRSVQVMLICVDVNNSERIKNLSILFSDWRESARHKGGMICRHQGILEGEEGKVYL